MLLNYSLPLGPSGTDVVSVPGHDGASSDPRHARSPWVVHSPPPFCVSLLCLLWLVLIHLNSSAQMAFPESLSSPSVQMEFSLRGASHSASLQDLPPDDYILV